MSGAGELLVEVNGEEMALPPGATVAAVVEAVGCGPRGVAVAVNSQLVRRAEWPARVLAEGDRVEVLRAAAGG